MRPLAVLAKALHRLTDLAFGAGCLILVLQVVSVSAAVVLRITGGPAVPGLLAMTEWSLVYFTFLVAPRLVRNNEHVSIDFLVERARPTVKWL